MARVNPLYAGMTFAGVLDGGARWPFPEGESEGEQVLHRDRFRTGRRRAPLEPIDVAANADVGSQASGARDELVLLTESRVNESRPSGEGNATIQVNPVDAATLGVADGDRVVVESDRGTVRLVANVIDDVRDGTVFAHASVVDPLVGSGRTRVRLSDPVE